jgi:uncharacterized protein YcfJ
MYNILELNNKYLLELREIAQSMGIEHVGIMKKPDLIFNILNLQPIKITASTPKKEKKSVNIVIEKPKTQKTGSFFKFFRQQQHWFSAMRRNFRVL